MIAFVKGTLEDYTEDGVVLETAAGIGLAVSVPASLLNELPGQGETVLLYTHFQVGEDSQKLYGFRSRDERELFRLLLRVSGIGPKLAMSVMSALSPDELRLAVASGDAKALTRAPGLGRKTAEKLILELKDKIGEAGLVPAGTGAAKGPTVISDAYSEAVAALTALGYSSSEALRAVRAVDSSEDMTVDEVLQAAFQKLSLL